MLAFILKRVIAAIPVLLGVSILVFIGMHLIPGDPAQVLLGDKGTPEELAQLHRDLGLDQPIYVQYARFLERAVRGDFGRSYRTRRPVMQDIAQAFPLTVELAVGAMVLASAAGLLAGVISGSHQNSLFDSAVMVLVLAGVSTPVFWTGILLILLFGVNLGWLPLSGVISDTVTLQRVTGSRLLDSVLTQNWAALWSVVLHLLLPVLTLGSVAMASIARLTRSSMLEVLREDYVRTAYAKGSARARVLYSHALPNALIPVITIIGLQIGGLLSGAVLTETVFSRPGLGRLAVTSILFRDYATVQAVVLVTSAIFVLLNLAVDVLYGSVDPRIRYG